MSGEKRPPHLDRVYLNARRETVVLLIGFAVFLIWTIGTSRALGYDIPPDQIEATVFGIPRWVFWGVCVPWMTANLFTFWYAGAFMSDDPLGEDMALSEDVDGEVQS